MDRLPATAHLWMLVLQRPRRSVRAVSHCHACPCPWRGAFGQPDRRDAFGFLIAWLLRDYGVVGVFADVTGCMWAVVVAIGAFGPRTNGFRLEDRSRGPSPCNSRRHHE